MSLSLIFLATDIQTRMFLYMHIMWTHNQVIVSRMLQSVLWFLSVPSIFEFSANPSIDLLQWHSYFSDDDSHSLDVYFYRLFRSVGKPRPSDHPLLILFVIGGITSTEVRQVRDVVSAAKGSLQVTIIIVSELFMFIIFMPPISLYFHKFKQIFGRL